MVQDKIGHSASQGYLFNEHWQEFVIKTKVFTKAGTEWGFTKQMVDFFPLDHIRFGSF